MIPVAAPGGRGVPCAVRFHDAMLQYREMERERRGLGFCISRYDYPVFEDVPKTFGALGTIGSIQT